MEWRQRVSYLTLYDFRYHISQATKNRAGFNSVGRLLVAAAWVAGSNTLIGPLIWAFPVLTSAPRLVYLIPCYVLFCLYDYSYEISHAVIQKVAHLMFKCFFSTGLTSI